MFNFPDPDLIGHFISPAVHGAGDGNGGGFLMVVESALDTVSQRLESGSSGNPFVGIEALGTNWHPLIVHFPIAFLAGFFLLELIGVVLRQPGLRNAASWMLYLGALGAITAAVAGLIAEDTVLHGSAVHDIMEWHERLGLTVAGLSSALAIWRLFSRERFSAMAQALHLFLGATVLVGIVFAADLGGLMVYQHGVGVKSLQVADDHHHHDGHEHRQAGSDMALDAHREPDSEEPVHIHDEPGSEEGLHTHDKPASDETAHTHDKQDSHKTSHTHGKPGSDKAVHTHSKPHSGKALDTHDTPNRKP